MIPDKPTDELISVPKPWFEGLLNNAIKAESALEKYEYGNTTNDRIIGTISVLIGYSKSSDNIIHHHNIKQTLNK